MQVNKNWSHLDQIPIALAPYYKRFRVAERLLLNGHSHQAWPDRAFEGQIRAFDDAAVWIDEKWERAFEVADQVRGAYKNLLSDSNGLYALSSSTHDLIVRFLSALPLRSRPRIVTTDGEFYTIRRQLHRLEEEGIEVVRVPKRNIQDVVPRLIAALDDKTAVVMVSSVMFESGHIVPYLNELGSACQEMGSELLVDIYHSLNVVPFSIPQMGLNQAYIVGGGYKYCQLGEGNCFLRFPQDCQLRPIATGWFAELFDNLRRKSSSEHVTYPRSGDRFAGGTYDPTSHYRAVAVFNFFKEFELDVQLLREVSQHQIGLLCEEFDRLDIDPKIIDRDRSVTREQVGGFLALVSPFAAQLRQNLLKKGVFCDSRGDILRLGPAPYCTDEQLKQALAILGKEIQTGDSIKSVPESRYILRPE